MRLILVFATLSTVGVTVACADPVTLGRNDAPAVAVNNAGTGGARNDSAGTGGARNDSAGTGGARNDSAGMGGARQDGAATYTEMSFEVGGGDAVCTSLAVPMDKDGRADCKVIELVLADHCDCTGPGRGPATDAQVAAGRKALSGYARLCDVPGSPACSSYCGCELLQMQGDALQSCQQDIDMSPDAAGFCYIDPANGVGNPALVAPPLQCPAWQDKLLRTQAPGLVVPDGSNTPFRATFMACAAKNPEEAPTAPGDGEVGAPCESRVAATSDLVGPDTRTVRVDTASSACATGLCLLNHEQYVPAPALGTPPPDLSQSAAFCSCRCDGPAGTGPFCACPGGFECAPLVNDIGLVSTRDVAGSYCVKNPTNP